MTDLSPICESLNVIDECGNLIKMSIFVDEPEEVYYMSYVMVVYIFVLDSNGRSFKSTNRFNYEDILRDISKYSICYLSRYNEDNYETTTINMITPDGKKIELNEDYSEEYHLFCLRKEIERMTEKEAKLRSIYPN